MKHCFIVGGGPECVFPERIPEGTYIIAADSGYDKCAAAGITPHLVIGDMDSIKGIAAGDIPVKKAPAEKDDTDVLLAVKTAFEADCGSFWLTGVTGGRAGHSMAAVGALEYIHSRGGKGVILYGGGKITLCGEGKHIFENGADYSYISVFALTDRAEVSMRGLKYGGEGMTLERTFPVGVSNEFSAKYGEIEVYKGKILVITEK